MFSGFVSAPMGITGAMMNVPILRYLGYPISKCIGSAAAIGFFISFTGSLGFILSGGPLNVYQTKKVSFDEKISGTSSGTTALDVNDFSLSISGGTATLSSTIPTSISYSENLRATNYSENIANVLTWGNNEPNNSGSSENYAHIGGYSAVEFGKFLINDHQESLSIKHILELENGSTSVSGYTYFCLLYTSPSPRDQRGSRIPCSG